MLPKPERGIHAIYIDGEEYKEWDPAGPDGIQHLSRCSWSFAVAQVVAASIAGYSVLAAGWRRPPLLQQSKCNRPSILFVPGLKEDEVIMMYDLNVSIGDGALLVDQDGSIRLGASQGHITMRPDNTLILDSRFQIPPRVEITTEQPAVLAPTATPTAPAAPGPVRSAVWKGALCGVVAVGLLCAVVAGGRAVSRKSQRRQEVAVRSSQPARRARARRAARGAAAAQGGS